MHIAMISFPAHAEWLRQMRSVSAGSNFFIYCLQHNVGFEHKIRGADSKP